MSFHRIGIRNIAWISTVNRTRVQILAIFIFPKILLTFIYKYVYSVQQRKKQQKNKAMNAQQSASKKGLVLSVTIYVVFMTVLILVLGTPSFGQTTTNNDQPCVAFRYDGFENPDYAPAAVLTVEQLEENAIDRKMEKYNAKGLPSMEEVKKNMIDIVIVKIILPKMPELGTIEENVSSLLTHLMKDDTKDSASVHLMKEDIGYYLYMAHLVNPDWGESYC